MWLCNYWFCHYLLMLFATGLIVHFMNHLMNHWLNCFMNWMMLGQLVLLIVISHSSRPQLSVAFLWDLIMVTTDNPLRSKLISNEGITFNLIANILMKTFSPCVHQFATIGLVKFWIKMGLCLEMNVLLFHFLWRKG